MPDFANIVAQVLSIETVPIIITTSSMRSSSAEPEIHTVLQQFKSHQQENAGHNQSTQQKHEKLIDGWINHLSL